MKNGYSDPGAEGIGSYDIGDLNVAVPTGFEPGTEHCSNIGGTTSSYRNSRNSRDRLQFDTTTPLSKAIKGIFNLEGEGFSSDLTLDGERVGEVHVHKRPEGWNVIDVYIYPDKRGNGYGKELYRDLNKKAYSEGSRLYSRERGDGGSVVVLPDGRRLLESFVEKGEAEKTDIGYRFKTSD